MSNCCSNSSPQTKAQLCPQCGKSCKSIQMRTIYHQLRFPENQSIASGSYYFCTDKICSVGYFSLGGRVIPKQHLRSYKEIENGKLCYCFDIDATPYISALKDKTAGPIKNFVIQKTKSGDCACDIRNPAGQCCLANFKQLEKEYTMTPDFNSRLQK